MVLTWKNNGRNQLSRIKRLPAWSIIRRAQLSINFNICNIILNIHEFWRRRCLGRLHYQLYGSYDWNVISCRINRARAFHRLDANPQSILLIFCYLQKRKSLDTHGNINGFQFVHNWFDLWVAFCVSSREVTKMTMR